MRHWKDQLSQMGISEKVIQIAEMSPSRDHRGVEYPCYYPPRVVKGDVVTDKITRIRILPDALEQAHQEGVYQPRFYNPKKKHLLHGEMPPFYVYNYEKLQNAIVANNGIVHVTEGDRDTWTLLNVDVHNVVGVFGASVDIGQPQIQFLYNLGVHTVIFYPDNDNAGYSLAQSMKEAMTKANITLIIKQVPYIIGDYVIKDVSDLWLYHNGYSDAFIETMSMLVNMDVKTKRQIESDIKGDVFVSDLYEEVENILFDGRGPDYSEEGWSRAVVCPFGNHEHDNHHPASHWHRDKHILNCFKCGTTYLSKDVARALKINVSEYFDNSKEMKKQESDVLGHLNANDMGLRFAPSITSLVMATGANPYTTMETGDFAVMLEDAVRNYHDRIEGRVLSRFPPIPFPIDALRDVDGLGGNMSMMQRPGMFAIYGASGGNKTTTITTIINSMLMQGYDGLVISPEWTPDDFAIRMVNQGGGMKTNEVLRLESYRHQLRQMKAVGVRADAVAYQDIERSVSYMEERIALTQTVINNYQSSRRGKLMIFNQFGANIFEYIQMVSEGVRRMREAGRDPAFIVFDYLQLAKAPHGMASTWSVEDTVLYLKWMAYRLGLVMFVTSQVRKDDTDTMNNEGYLDDTSGMGVRSDQFNLVLTLNPRHTFQTNNGTLMKILHVRVVKNSTGGIHLVHRNGKSRQYEFAEVYVNLDNLIIVDRDWNNSVFAKMSDKQALAKHLYERYGIEPSPDDSSALDYEMFDSQGIEYVAD